MRARHRSLIVCVILACAIATFPMRTQSRDSLIVYAATSLTDAFEQLASDFEQTYSDVEIVLNFASSSTLAAQLLEGAQADVFASANEARMDQIVGDGLIAPEAVEIFARNQLVLALPLDNPARIASIADLASKPALLVLAVRGTPIRDYTDAMLQSYGKELGEDFVERVLDNLVSEESNVRQVVTRVALGEADAGIVYQTDVIGEIGEQVFAIHIDQEHNQLASYPIAILEHTPKQALARTFVDFVLSDQGQSVLNDFGFCSTVDIPEEAHPGAAPESEALTDGTADEEVNPCEDTAPSR